VNFWVLAGELLEQKSEIMNKYLRFLIFFYFLIVIIKIILSFSVPYLVYIGDEVAYFQISRQITSGDFSFKLYGKPIFYPPLYSISILITGFIDKLIAVPMVKIINSFLSTSIIFPVYFISKEFFKKKDVIYSPILSVFIPESFIYSFTILSENLYYPMFILTFYLFFKALTNKDKKLDLLCGISLGLLILTRAIGVVLLFTVFLVTLIKKKFFKKYRIFLFTFIILIPWFIHNIYTFGLSGLFGYSIEATNLVTSYGIVLLELIKFGSFSLAYIIFGSGILFFALTILLTKKNTNLKIYNFILIFLFVSIFNILISTIWSLSELASSNVQPFSGIGNKIMGRYLSSITPLIFISGSIGFLYRYKKKEIIFSFIICYLFLSLLPINNLLSGFDQPSTWILWAPMYLYNFSPILIKMILIGSIFIFLIFINFFFQLKNAFLITATFLIILCFVGTFSIHIASLDSKDYNEFAIWIHKNFSSDATIFIDKRAPGRQLTWLENSLIFWTENKIIVGDIRNNTQSVDYVLSPNQLNLTLVTKLDAKEGMYKPLEETVFMYKT